MAWPHQNLGAFLHPPKAGGAGIPPGGNAPMKRPASKMPPAPVGVPMPPVGVGSPNPMVPAPTVAVGPPAQRPSIGALLNASGPKPRMKRGRSRK